MIDLIACSICLRVRRGPEWLDAEHVIRDILVVRRVLAEAVLAKRRAEVFEARWTGRRRDTQTPLRQAIQEFLTVYSQPRKVSWKDDRFMLGWFFKFLGPNAHLQDIDRRRV